MKKTYVGLIITGACLTAFVGGIMAGYFNSREKTPEAENNVTPVIIEAETLPKEEKIPDRYEIQLEGGYIVLHEVFDDNTKKEIERAEINTNVLPTQDVKLLKEGIVLQYKDEALMMIENFVS